MGLSRLMHSAPSTTTWSPSPASQGRIQVAAGLDGRSSPVYGGRGPREAWCRGRLAGALAVLALFTLPAVAASGSGVAENFARPALQEFEDASIRLAVAANGLCAVPGPEMLASTRTLFVETATAFGRATVLRFGPMAAENRFEKLFFWPDARGIALKQVQEALAGKDESLADVTALAGKSVALQGLPALEFALFGTGAHELVSPPAGFRCRYAAAVAANIAYVAGELTAGWAEGTPFAASFTNPQAGAEPYRTQAEVDGEIVTALATLVQFVRAAELQPPLGESADKGNGRLAPLWRSDATFSLMAAQIAGARDMLLAAGYAESLPADQAWLPGQLRFGLEAARRALEQIDSPAEKAFDPGDDRGRVEFANVALDGVGHDVSEKLSAALGLTMGFNALDGD
jgi:predicted lipoprotein